MFLYNLTTSCSFSIKNDSSDNSSDNIYRTIVLMPKLYDPQKRRRKRIYQKKLMQSVVIHIKCVSLHMYLTENAQRL